MIVYLITNKVNGKQYVGQTVQALEERWRKHIAAVHLGSKYYFHKALRKYGEEKFSVITLHKCLNKEEMDFVETFYISLLGTKAPRGYNSTYGGEGTSGHRHTESSIEKMRFSHVGFLITKEHREKLSRALKGVPKSKEHKKKISLGRKGMKFSPEHSRNIGIAHIKAACKRGHPRVTENLKGTSCRLCINFLQRERYHGRKQEAHSHTPTPWEHPPQREQ